MLSRRVTMKRLLFLILCATATYSQISSASAATYTVCSSGCTATSFSALFSAVDLAGNDIVEARADSPGGSATFQGSVAPGPNDYGTFGQPLIIRARAGDTITIDANGAQYGISITSSAINNITFDGFNIINYNYSGVYLRGNSAVDKLTGIAVQNCNVTSNYSVVEAGTTQGIMLYRVDSITVKNNTVHIADVYDIEQTDCFYLQEASNVDINGNYCWDQNQNGDGHNDGIQVAGGNGTSIAYGATYNLTIRNNTLVHNNTHSGAKQLIYLEYEIGGNNYIYNNIAYVTTGSPSNMISVANKGYGTHGNFFFYNNTFRAKNSQIAFKTDVYSPNITFKNNIVYSESIVMHIMNTLNSPANFENNTYYNPSGSINKLIYGINYADFAEWTLIGFDNNYGVWGDPLFASTTSYPYSLHLLVGSPAINVGADLSATFTTDKNLVSRPQGSAWDIGAYESIGPLRKPNPVSNLRFM